MRGASWEQGKLAGGFLRPQEGSRDPGMLCEQGEQAGGFLRPQEGFRDPGMLRGERSELGVRKESWGLPSLLAPTEVVGTLKHSITIWLAPLTPAHSPHSSLLQLASACSQLTPLTPSLLPSLQLTPACFSLVPLLPACCRDPGMLWEQGEKAGSKGSNLRARGVSWEQGE